MTPALTAAEHGRERRIAGFELQRLNQWTAYQIPRQFPIQRGADKDRLHTALNGLIDRLQSQDALPGVWLSMDTLHRDDAVQTLSRNARTWRPSMGLGIRPDQPPPRTMTGKDLLDLEWGSTPQLPFQKVTQLRAAPNLLRSAWTTMFGCGSTILTLGPGGGERMLGETREYLKGPITDESFQHFPFYFPMLGMKVVNTATPEQMDRWLGPTQLYLRESEEDDAILLITRSTPESLRDALDASGFEFAKVQSGD